MAEILFSTMYALRSPSSSARTAGPASVAPPGPFLGSAHANDPLIRHRLVRPRDCPGLGLLSADRTPVDSRFSAGGLARPQRPSGGVASAPREAGFRHAF